MRNVAARSHHAASTGSRWPGADSSSSRSWARSSHESSSHRFITCGHRPVDPTTVKTPKQRWRRSPATSGTQFAVMWCWYRLRSVPTTSTSSWMYTRGTATPYAAK